MSSAHKATADGSALMSAGHPAGSRDWTSKVEAVELESGTYVQRITIGERSLLIPTLRDVGQAEHLCAELRALPARLLTLLIRVGVAPMSASVVSYNT
jgi:hypothetical protein